MNQTIRYVLFIALSLAIMLIWGQLFTPKPAPKGAPPKPAETAQGGTTPQGAGGTPAPTPAPGTTPAPTPPATTGTAPEIKPETEPQPGSPIAVDSQLWTATFNPRGAGLSSFVLKGAKQSQRSAAAGVDLAHPGLGQPLPLAVEFPTLGGGAFGPDAVYQAEPAAPGKTEQVFTRTKNGITVTKRFSWTPDSYQLHLDVSVSGAPAGSYPMRVLYPVNEPPTPSGGMFSFGSRPENHATVCLIEGDRSMTSKAFSSHKPLEPVPGKPLFTGIDEKYFIAAMSPGADPAPATCQIGSTAQPGDNEAVLERTLTVAGGPVTTNVDLFLGPKDANRLAAADHGLTKSIDFGYYGLLTIISEALLFVLKLLYGIARNWGIAIILLTVLVKLLTLPLAHKQMVSMEEGKRLAPLVEKIKTKYAGDQERINIETMKLYKEHNYQPLAGCLPMLIQMPVWFALYAALSNSFELYKEPFIHGWIGDLTARDPYYILPVAMTVTMILTQVLTPQAGAPNQQMKTMMYVMPVMFGFFMLSLPAGLVLYIFTNNVLSIGQSLWFRRRMANLPPTPAAG